MADNKPVRSLLGRKLRRIVVGFLVVVAGVAVNVAVLRMASKESKRRQEATAQRITEYLRKQGLNPEEARKMADSAVTSIEQMDYSPSDLQTATNATYVFAYQLSEGRYDAIYDASFDGLRQQISRDSFTGALKTINQKAGVCGDVVFVSTGVGRDAGGAYVQQRFTRRCANISETKEEVSWAMVDGTARLREYRVFNPEFTH